MANLDSNKGVLDQNRRENENGEIEIGRKEFDSEGKRALHLAGVFPGMVRAGKFVEAMELVHGDGSFNWFYRLFDKSSWSFRSKKEKEKRTDSELKSVKGDEILARALSMVFIFELFL